jgi:hypothetical protein
MSNNQRSNQSNQSNQGREYGQSDKSTPWNVYRLKEVPPKRDGEKSDTRFLECGVAWQMKNREGFTIDLDFAVPEGARLAIMPRTHKGE